MPFLYTRTFVAVLLLTFMVKTFAAPVSCATTAPAKKIESHQNMMKHNMQIDVTMSHQMKSIKADCCDSDCSCPASVCSSFTMITNNIADFAPLAQHHKVNQLPIFILQSYVNSLFRPPRIA